MNQFSSKQKQKEKLISQFVNFTQSNEKKAMQFLTQHDWKLDLAVDAFYLSLDSSLKVDSLSAASGAASAASAGRSSSMNVDRKKLDALWESYKGFVDFVEFSSFFVIFCC